MACRYRLRSAVWEITLACCFSCRYCGSGGGRARENELSTEECLDVCRQLAELGCRRVSLIGGEVFMRKDWLTVTEGLTSRGIAVNIITNGFLFSEKLIGELKSARIESVSVSLDGLRDVHDRYRQAGSWDRAVRAVDVLAEAGIPVSVITTLNAENAAQLDDFYAFLRQKPIGAWQLQACSPMGNAANGGVDFCFPVKQVIRFVEEKRRDAPFAMGIADNIGYWTDGEGGLRGNDDSAFDGCRAGLSAVGIDSVGNVRGCESLYDDRFIEGNLRERSLRAVWEDPNAFSYNRGFRPEMLSGACAACPYGSLCAAGCRSYNYFVHGKLYEAPRCARFTE